MHFDSVTISISDGIKQGDYAPPKSFNLTGIVTSADEAIVTAGIEALRKAGEAYLGRNTVTAVKREPKPKETPAPAADPLAPATSAPAPSSDPTASSAGPASTAPSSDPLSGAPSSQASADPLEGAAPQASADPLTGAAPPAAEITDDELVHAVMKKNEALGDATLIRALIESYNPAPGLRVFKATEIGQADRPAFLAKVAELVKP